MKLQSLFILAISGMVAASMANAAPATTDSSSSMQKSQTMSPADQDQGDATALDQNTATPANPSDNMTNQDMQKNDENNDMSGTGNDSSSDNSSDDYSDD